VLERAQGPERSGSTENVGCLKVDGNKSSISFLGIYKHFTLVYVVVLCPYGRALPR
jgi:hypothetical protein